MVRTRFFEIGVQGKKGHDRPYNRKLRLRIGSSSRHFQLWPPSPFKGKDLMTLWDPEAKRLVTMWRPRKVRQSERRFGRK